VKVRLSFCVTIIAVSFSALIRNVVKVVYCAERCVEVECQVERCVGLECQVERCVQVECHAVRCVGLECQVESGVLKLLTTVVDTLKLITAGSY